MIDGPSGHPYNATPTTGSRNEEEPVSPSTAERSPAGTRRPAVLGTTLAMAGALALAAACGSSSSPGSGTSNPPAATTSAAPVKVTVDETEFKITLSQPSFSPGTYEFAVTDSGKFPHNFIINGPGVDNQKIPAGSPLTPGQSASLTVTLQKGSYEIWCGVPTHKEKGMDMTIQVA
jgi:uncharacterized cupredoxin-like copper-binding protein